MVDQSGNELIFEVKQGEEGLLKTFIREIKQISRKSLSDIKNKGTILCNNKEVTVRHIVISGDIITLRYPPEEKSTYLSPESIPIDIVYEDEDVLVINKQSGICMHPTKGEPSGTLANGVLFHWFNKEDYDSGFHAVNRLDRNTSGIVLVAKNKFAKQQLTLQQQSKTLQRSYVAICEGVIQEESGTIETPIGRDENHSTKRMVRDDGQLATTRFEVLRKLKNHTFIRVNPKTGRTHQIRVHMSSIGHPLAGDDLYGGSHVVLPRQALHADKMLFTHPRTEEELTFSLPPPEDMENAIKTLY